jgi:hypothetical protein
MTIEEWWPRLDWLVENNGDNVIDVVAAAINAVGGLVTPGAPLADGQIDWIEATANDEVG